MKLHSLYLQCFSYFYMIFTFSTFLFFFITQVHYQEYGLHSRAYSSFSYTRINSLVRVIHVMDIFLLSLPVIFTFNMLYSHISCTYFTWLRHTCIHNNMTSFIIIHYEILPFILVLFPFILYILSHSMCPLWSRMSIKAIILMTFIIYMIH